MKFERGARLWIVGGPEVTQAPMLGDLISIGLSKLSALPELYGPNDTQDVSTQQPHVPANTHTLIDTNARFACYFFL